LQLLKLVFKTRAIVYALVLNAQQELEALPNTTNLGLPHYGTQSAVDLNTKL